MIKQRTVPLLLLLLSIVPLTAQPIVKGQKYFVRIPEEVFKFSGFVGRSTTIRTIAVVDGAADGAMIINDNANWLAAGKPGESTYKLKKSEADKASGRYVVTLERDRGGFTDYELHFTDAAAAAALLPRLLIPASDTAAVEAWRAEADAELIKSTFVGPLSALPDAAQRALIGLVGKTTIVSLGHETFKDQSYLVVNLGVGPNVYNTLQVDRPRRVARSIANDMLPVLKAVHPKINPCPSSLAGMKVQIRAEYKNFLTESESGLDTIHFYAPCDAIGKFLNADITSQALVEQSIVLVNGDRVEVTLAP